MKQCPVCAKDFKPTNRRQVCCSTSCHKIRKPGKADAPSPDAPTEVISQSDQELAFHLRPTRIQSLEELVEHFKVDLDKWKCKTFIANKWEMGSVNRLTGDTQVTPLYQVKATFIPNAEMREVSEKIADLKASAAKWAPRIPRPPRPRHIDPCLLELSFYDVHLGKLGWSKETGYADWDSTIATKVFWGMFDDLLEKTSHYKFDRILFPIGNDFFQVDSPANTTTSGTQVDVDSRFKRTYKHGRQLVCEAIERLHQIADVDVVMISGNHDRFSNFTLGDSLECYFRNTKGVNIDNRPMLRKYYQYGNTLLGLTHGDKLKAADYFSLMPSEAPVEFASTLWREWHTGHYHKDALAEKHGIRVRTLAAVSGTDEYHSGHGFVGNQRLAEAFVWHPVRCLESIHYSNLPEPRPGQKLKR